MISVHDYDQIDQVQHLWRELMQSNIRSSVYFAEYFRTFQFETRKELLAQKIAEGFAVRIFLLNDDWHDGFCLISYHKIRSCAEIEMIFVRDELRRQGHGSCLMNAALETLHHENIKNISLNVTYGNDGAIRFYEKYGFHPFALEMLCLK